MFTSKTSNRGWNRGALGELQAIRRGFLLVWGKNLFYTDETIYAGCLRLKKKNPTTCYYSLFCLANTHNQLHDWSLLLSFYWPVFCPASTHKTGSNNPISIWCQALLLRWPLKTWGPQPHVCPAFLPETLYGAGELEMVTLQQLTVQDTFAKLLPRLVSCLI